MQAGWLSNFFRRRFSEIVGLSLVSLGIFFAVSFATYHPDDPSFNYATDTAPSNLAGIPGAYIAEPVIEFIGLACLLLVFAPIAWGAAYFMKRTELKLWLRTTMLVIGVIPLSGLFAMLDLYSTAPQTWDADSFGGYIGAFMYKDLSPVLTDGGFAGLTATLTAVTIFYTMAIPLAGWAWGTGTFFGAIAWLLKGSYTIGRRIAGKPVIEEEKPKKAGKSTKIARKKRITKKEKSPVEVFRKRKDVAISMKDSEPQTSFDLKQPDEIELPKTSFLKAAKNKKESISDSALSQNAELLEKVLDDFGINGKIIRVRPGPVVTLYELEPAAGTKSSRVIGLSDDIARSMSAISARIAVIPGQNAIGIELPNDERHTVYLRQILESEEYEESETELPLALGKDIGGDPVIADLAKMPHLLVAGTTGSGKSVAINTMILSLLYRYTPKECRFIMIDPKMLELSVYEGIPHLLTPVVTEPNKAVVALKWTVKEMENRYRLMSNMGVRNIGNYNERIIEAAQNGEKLTRSVQTGFDRETGRPIIEDVELDMNPLPFIVVVVDEMADLMLVGGKEIETSIQRLAQMARAAGIHIIMATQRPSVDVITGVIKANFPTRISFQVTSRIDSRTILGDQGAEQLLGQGDMLYMAGGGKISRVHGPFVDDKEVEKVVSFLKKQGSPVYLEEVTKEEEESDFMSNDEPADELYDKAVNIVLSEQKASTSFIQRQLKIGYNRAANIMDRMEKEGVVSEANHVGKREILVALQD